MSSDPDSPRRAASRIDSIRHAFAGWGHVLRTQPNARIHGAATIGVAALAVWLELTRIEGLLLLLTVALVWIAEFLNTAIEAVVDLASPERHPLAKAAKDTAAAAVLAAALTSVLVGLAIFGPPLWQRAMAAIGAALV